MIASKRFLKIHFKFAHFLSCSFGVETTNILIHDRSSLVNHTRFQTKMGKIYTRFQTKTAQKPHQMGRHICTYMAYLRECPPRVVMEASSPFFTCLKKLSFGGQNLTKIS